MRRKLGSRNLLYPMPATVVGTMVGGRPNFCNIAHVGILNASPPHLLSLGMHKSHLSNKGIRDNKTVGISILSADRIVDLDYVGLVSGARTDKSTVFEVAFGELGTAPLVADAPLAMECRLRDIYDIGTHDVFIVEVVQAWADEAVLVEGKPDLSLVKPVLFDMSGPWYWSLGSKIGKPWSIGKGRAVGGI
jgi:flavin reductase (DIM6/NTAB) family NADH-FMN oxidoreductase RutF